jgi:hypothetical protein
MPPPLTVRIGEQFGDWTVIADAGQIDRRTAVTVQCVCGRVVDRQLKRLRIGRSTSCGCRNKVEDVTGECWGNWIILREVKTSGVNRRVEAKCDCGTVKIVHLSSLRAGTSKTCGCAVRTHGFYGTKTYHAWRGILWRCGRSRGYLHVKVCDRWRRFEAFLADMGECPPGLTIERVDNAGHYEPGNCRWAPMREQARNKGNNRLLTFEGRTMVLTDWAAELGMNRTTLQGRLRKGWAVERALTEPVRRW